MSKFDEALERMKAGLAEPGAKQEGTFSIFNLRAVAQEMALLRNEMEILQNNWSLDTATGAYLDARAKDYGLMRKSAAYAWGTYSVKGTKGATVASGTKLTATAYGVTFVTVGDVVLDSEGKGSGKVMASAYGSSGNLPAGTVLEPVASMPGFSDWALSEASTGGADRESDTDFRARIYQKIRYPQTSGNVYHYMQWASEVSGVGKVKVFPLWDGPGTVKVSILDASGSPASSDLIQAVQDYIDPEPGRGSGQAPIGAVVTVSTATAKAISVSATVKLGTKGGLESVKAAFAKRLTDYFADKAYDGTTESISPALVGRELLEVDGVVDYAGLTLDGGTDAVAIGEEEIPAVGTVTLATAG